MMLSRAFIILAVFYATLSLATPEDRKKSISVDADYAARNEITGETEYRGNVIIPVSYTHLTLPTRLSV